MVFLVGGGNHVRFTFSTKKIHRRDVKYYPIILLFFAIIYLGSAIAISKLFPKNKYFPFFAFPPGKVGRAATLGGQQPLAPRSGG